MILNSLTWVFYPLPMASRDHFRSAWGLQNLSEPDLLLVCLFTTLSQPCLCLAKDLIDPDHDPWTTSQLDLSPVSSLWSSLLITGQYLTLVTITKPVPDLWVNFLPWPQPGFVTTDLFVPHPRKLVWRSGLWADSSCWFWACSAPFLVPVLPQPCYCPWLPGLQEAAVPRCFLTLTWECILSPLAWAKKPGQLGKLS